MPKKPMTLAQVIADNPGAAISINTWYADRGTKGDSPSTTIILVGQTNTPWDDASISFSGPSPAGSDISTFIDEASEQLSTSIAIVRECLTRLTPKRALGAVLSMSLSYLPPRHRHGALLGNFGVTSLPDYILDCTPPKNHSDVQRAQWFQGMALFREAIHTHLDLVVMQNTTEVYSDDVAEFTVNGYVIDPDSPDTFYKDDLNISAE